MRISRTQTGTTRIGIPWGLFQRVTGISDINSREEIRCDVEIDEDYMITVTLAPDVGRYKTTIEYRPEHASLVKRDTIVRVANVHNNTLGTQDCMPFGPMPCKEVSHEMGRRIGEGIIMFSVPPEIRPLIGQPTKVRPHVNRDRKSKAKGSLATINQPATPEVVVETSPTKVRPSASLARAHRPSGRSPNHDAQARARTRPAPAPDPAPDMDLDPTREPAPPTPVQRPTPPEPLPPEFANLRAASRELNRCIDLINTQHPYARVSVVGNKDPHRDAIRSVTVTVGYKVS